MVQANRITLWHNFLNGKPTTYFLRFFASALILLAGKLSTQFMTLFLSGCFSANKLFCEEFYGENLFWGIEDVLMGRCLMAFGTEGEK